MKPRILAEQQTVSLTRVHPRIEVRHREYEPGKFTNDVEVDGNVWTVALSPTLLNKFVPVIQRQVEAHPNATHAGYGTWEPKRDMTPTPGPWVVGDQIRREYRAAGVRWETMIHVGSEDPKVGRGNAFAVVTLGGPGATSASADDVLANACLMAASPDLYDALRNLIADWERVTGKTIPEDHEAKAALAKAEGRTK